MKRILSIILLLPLCIICAGAYGLKNDKIAVEIAEDGTLSALTNVQTGQNYASGGYLWRLYYDCPNEKEIEVKAGDQKPVVTQKDDRIIIEYRKLAVRNGILNADVILEITLDGDKVRFGSKLSNNEPHTVLREFQYPLLRNAQLPADHKLYTAEHGGTRRNALFQSAQDHQQTCLIPVQEA